MPEWLPWVVGLGGGTGIGAFLKVFIDGRSSANAHSIALLKTYQEDRKADREVQDKLTAKVDEVLALYADERDYSTILLAWGLAGAPPPPPARRIHAPSE